MPPRMRISVDLPAPFSPTRAWTSPASTSSETSCSARTPGKDLEILLISRSGLTVDDMCPQSHSTLQDDVRVGGLLAGTHDTPHPRQQCLKFLVRDVLQRGCAQQA